MSNLVEKFIEDVRMAEQLSDSKRPLAIRQKITNTKRSLFRMGAVARKSGQYLDKQKTERFRQ